MRLADLERRDGWPLVCWHCGTTEGLSLQHRANRGMGGRPSLDGWANAIALCWSLNVACEQDADVAEWATRAGWKLSSHAEPVDEPVWHAPDQRWVWLCAAGHQHHEAPLSTCG